MPAESDKQAVAAIIALAVKKGEAIAKPGSPSAKMAKSMSKKQIRHFTHKEDIQRMPTIMFGQGFKK
jgi:hypothetical protein